jgi:hypothetical protein
VLIVLLSKPELQGKKVLRSLPEYLAAAVRIIVIF